MQARLRLSRRTGLLLAALAASGLAHAASHPIDFDRASVKPTPAQAAAIHRAARSDLAECGQPEQACYALALADLNDDGRADLLLMYTPASGFCGSTGCSGALVMATAQGYAATASDLPNSYGFSVLSGKHHGMHDLQFDGDDGPVWHWDGRAYAIARRGH